MKSLIKGRVWKLEDNNIDTDVIVPTKYLTLSLQELKDHVLEPIRPGFAQEVRPGDVIIAGKNFGCGSSREHAVTALKALQIGAIVAESFARIFFRNAIALALPVLTCLKAPQYFNEGDIAEVNMEEGIVKNMNQDKLIRGVPWTQDMLDILKRGGLLALLQDKVKGT